MGEPARRVRCRAYVQADTPPELIREPVWHAGPVDGSTKRRAPALPRPPAGGRRTGRKPHDTDMNLPLQPLRFEDGPAMLLAGLRQTHTFAAAAEGIAAQWRAFHALGPIPHQRGTAHYGVLCGGDPQAQTMEYMCAVEVAEFDAAGPPGRMRVPPQRYAVFEHTGPPSAVRQTWTAIWNQALPRAGLALAHGPEFEVYGERFNAAAGTGVIEIWAAVHPRAGG